MYRQFIPKFTGLALSLLVCAGAQATSISTTLTVNATVSLTTLTTTGTASLSNGVGSGTFTTTTLTVNQAATAYTGQYTIALTGGATITGVVTVPLGILETGAGTASATVTGGTGTYAGATGSFPSLAGTGALGATGLAVTFVGPGTITTGGTVLPPPTPSPTITDVLDAASNTENLAQGSIFIVKGTTLCPSQTNGVTFYNVPRPTTGTDGVKITFTPAAGGSSTDALLWYEYNSSGTTQLAGILPSTVAVGTYNVTVTNGSVSTPFVTQVMQSKFELFTQDSSGTGMASVQNYISAAEVDLNSFTSGTGKSTTISPAHPGQYLIAYGTGMGPLVGQDNTAAPAFDFSTAPGYTVLAIVGGVSIPVAYAGRAGYAGEDQINFVLPATIPTGCTVSLQISVNGVLSAPTFIAIAPTTAATACVQAGFTATQLQSLDQGGTYNYGSLELLQVQESVASATVKYNSASGSFTRYTGSQLAGAVQASTFTPGACVVTQSTSSTGTAIAASSGIGLDAGTLTLNGPAGSSISNLAFTETGTGVYNLQLASQGLPTGGGTGTIVAGQYTVTGSGGKDVGAISNASITIGSPLTITGGLPSTVTRSAGMTLNWTGGNATDLVEIVGGASTTKGSGASALTSSFSFLCTTTAGAGTFTVPSSVLLQLPVATAGTLEVVSSVTPTTFTAPLTAGGTLTGNFLSLLGFGGQVSYQ